MKLLILSRYDRQGASSRVRFAQYWPYLEGVGFDVDLQSFFDENYLPALYANRGTGASIPRAYLQRLGVLVHARKDVDMIWLEKEAFPWVPGALERWLFPSGVPLVSDFDDAVYHRYDMHPRALVRRSLGQKYVDVMKRSACVFAGNRYLADYAASAAAPAVEIIPTVVNTQEYRVRSETQSETAPVIGWIGTPSTWRECVEPYLAVLRAVADTEAARINAVGARMDPDTQGAIRFLPWTEESEIDQIQSMDIGIMPLPDTPWMRGKCGYKLIQYMACGLPVVASPVGVNTEIVEHGVNGFLAETPQEWSDALKTLIHDPVLRKRMGAAGRKRVEASYSLQVYGPRVATMLREIAENGRHARRSFQS